MKGRTINMLIQAPHSHFWRNSDKHSTHLAYQPHEHTYLATVSFDSAPQTDKKGNDGETSQITLISKVNLLSTFSYLASMFCGYT